MRIGHARSLINQGRRSVVGERRDERGVVGGVDVKRLM